MLYRNNKRIVLISKGQRAIYKVYKGVQLVWSKLSDAWYDNDVWRSDEPW